MTFKGWHLVVLVLIAYLIGAWKPTFGNMILSKVGLSS